MLAIKVYITLYLEVHPTGFHVMKLVALEMSAHKRDTCMITFAINGELFRRKETPPPPNIPATVVRTVTGQERLNPSICIVDVLLQLVKYTYLCGRVFTSVLYIELYIVLQSWHDPVPPVFDWVYLFIYRVHKIPNNLRLDCLNPH